LNQVSRGAAQAISGTFRFAAVLIKDAYFEDVVVGFPQDQAVAAYSKIPIANALSKGRIISGNRPGSFNKNEVVP
jgi:hypothetical protein